MSQNKRIFYACEAVALRPLQYNNGSYTAGQYDTMLGVQSVGMTSNFNLEKVFTLGQLAQYESIENNPEIEVTINKVFDGTRPLYLQCMGGSKNTTGGSLMEFANNRVDMKFGVYRDISELSVTGSGLSHIESTGMFLQSVSFTFPTDGNATEDVTLVSTHKKWYAGGFAGITSEKAAPSLVRRWKFDLDSSDFPYGEGGMKEGSPVTSVTISADLNREPVYTLGSFSEFDRSIQFPVEVTCEIESLALDLDAVELDQSKYSCNPTNTDGIKNFPIKVVVCGRSAGSSLTIDLGKRNKLNTISYGGGEAGGGNLTVTYSFTTDNALTVTAQGTYGSVDGCAVNSETGEVTC